MPGALEGPTVIACSTTTARVETPEGDVELIAQHVIVEGERPTLPPAPKLGEHDLALRHEFRGRPDAIRRGAAGGTKS
jgi:hypothetical protein